MKKKLLAGGAVLAIIFGMAGVANAIPTVVDQQQLLKDGSVGFWSDLQQAQTFTAGISGQLAQLNLNLYEDPPAINEVAHLTITEWNVNNPGAVLGSVDLYVDSFFDGNIESIDLLPENIFLNAGSQYAIVLANDLFYYDPPDPPKGSAAWIQWDTDPYAMGSLWTRYEGTWTERTGSDMWFQTHVIPEPSSIAMIGLVSGCAVFVRRFFLI